VKRFKQAANTTRELRGRGSNAKLGYRLKLNRDLSAKEIITDENTSYAEKKGD
jgi:hypothetical protein